MKPPTSHRCEYTLLINKININLVKGKNLKIERKIYIIN